MSADIKKGNMNSIASESFLNYAEEVIKERAIPHIEDNLKPVHRRILATLYKEKLLSTAKAKKSAATVGETMKTHPHGDASIYDAMVRLSQDFKMRYPLVTMQGNNGNINGAPAASMRYTEAKLSPIGDLMVQELSEKAVPYMPTYDNEGTEPTLMPSAFPNILCNGNMGIAVGMSSSILPHNLREAVDALVELINNPLLTIDELVKIMPGPDLPTGGVITNIEKINDIYATGSGTLEVESKYHIEEKSRETHIVFTEIPYMINMDNIVSKIKTLAAENMLDGVIDLQNNTGREGLELRVITKAKANISRILNVLFEKTGLRNNIRTGLTVLKDNKPVQTGMLGLMKGYLDHRSNVIVSIFGAKKEKAEARLHIVEGLVIATQDIDGVVALIKGSASTAEAREGLITKYKLSEIQAKAILDMRLSQLTRIDAQKIENERKELIKNIEYFILVLSSQDERNKIIKEQLLDVKKKFGDGRRTVLRSTSGVDDENFVELNYLVSLNKDNSISAVLTSDLMSAGKNRVGKKIFSNIGEKTIQLNNRNMLLIADVSGRIFGIPGSKLSAAENMSLESFDARADRRVTSILEATESDMQKEFFVVFTKNGQVKKTVLEDYKNFKPSNIGIKLREGDEVIGMAFGNTGDFIVVAGEDKINKYSLDDIRSTGRNTLGVVASELSNPYGYVVGNSEDQIALYGKGAAKRVLIKDIPQGSRLTKGVVMSEDTTAMSLVKRPNPVVIGKDGRGYLLEGTDIERKTIKNVNNNIYNGQVLDLVY